MNIAHAAVIAGLALSSPALAAPLAVTVQDKGRATRCDEEDNVYIAMSNRRVRRFNVIARQPVYGAGLKTDIQQPDFTNCAISAAHDFDFTPRTVTLLEDAKVKVVGVAYPRYWRPEQVAVEVAGRRDRGFHLLQLFVKRGGRAQEVMVLHVADGYWRLRPLPLPQFKTAVYGTSFLLGPIQERGRPFVRIAKVVIDPEALTVRALFAAGGEARVRLLSVDNTQSRLGVSLSPRAAAGPMFAAIRSMYVAPDEADAARVVWPADGAVKSASIVGFAPFQAASVRFGRTIPSRHNTAAPDIMFDSFDDGR